MEASGIHTGNIATDGGHAIVGNDNQIIQNLYHSASYQAMESQRQKLLERIRKYPDDSDFRQELARLLQQMEDFKRDVLKLAEDFQRISLNSERLKLAKQHFDAGEYVQARAVLDADSITQEQDALLTEQQRLQEKQAAITAQLDDKANEWLLKAHLTAIDYSLGDQRIAQTSSYFEKALKSGRTPDRLFTYAYFLQRNNQYLAAETLYSEVLSSYRQLAKDNPAVYLPHVAITLNNLGILVVADCKRREESEAFFTEALTLRRQLAKANPAVYLPDVAATLNNIGNLVTADSQRRKEAEILYSEALNSYRQFAKNNPAVYLPDVAGTLNNLGLLVAVDSQRRKEAETLYSEALTIRRELAKDNPAAYLSDVATTLNNLGNLIAVDRHRCKEAETLYSEALSSYRQLAADNPAAYLPDVATTLNNFGNLIAADSQRYKEAETLFNDALTLRREFAKANPAVYLPDVAATLSSIGLLVAADRQRRKEAETLFNEALTLRRELVKGNPTVYLPYMADTLAAFGGTYLLLNELTQALPLLQESAQLFEPLAQQSPSVFGEKHNLVLQLIEQIKATKR